MRRDEPARVAVGYVAGAKGVRGEVGIQSLTWDAERFVGLRDVCLERDGQPARVLRIESCRKDARGPLLKFLGIDTPEAARAQLVGGYLTVGRDEVPSPPEGSYYVFQVVGCQVVDAAGGHLLGEVTEVLDMPSTDVYVVRPEGGGEVLVPAVRDVVESVDLEARRIVVRGVGELFAGDGPAADG